MTNAIPGYLALRGLHNREVYSSSFSNHQKSVQTELNSMKTN